MILKIILLILIIPILLAPIFLSDRLKVDGSIMDDLEKIRRRTKGGQRRKYPRWNGPKTDEGINQMLKECIDLLKGLGVPISESICPDVMLTSTHVNFGRCCPKGSLKKYTDYDFYIEISRWTLKNTEKSLRNTLIHELIHTVPGGLCHTGEWKKWAKFVSEKTEYTIQYRGGDETAQDVERLVSGGYN